MLEVRFSIMLASVALAVWFYWGEVMSILLAVDTDLAIPGEQSVMAGNLRGIDRIKTVDAAADQLQ